MKKRIIFLKITDKRNAKDCAVSCGKWLINNKIYSISNGKVKIPHFQILCDCQNSSHSIVRLHLTVMIGIFSWIFCASAHLISISSIVYHSASSSSSCAIMTKAPKNYLFRSESIYKWWSFNFISEITTPELEIIYTIRE